jgi:hypothetical protein
MEKEEIFPIAIIVFVCGVLMVTEQSPFMVLIIAIIGTLGIAGVGVIKAIFGS